MNFHPYERIFIEPHAQSRSWPMNFDSYEWKFVRVPVRGGPVSSGHYLPEEAPVEVLERFERFFG